MTQDPNLPTQVLDSMSHAVMVTDAEGVIVSVNAAYCRITGWRPKDRIASEGSTSGNKRSSLCS